MNYYPLTDEQQGWKDRVAAIAVREIGPRAAGYDERREFPEASLNALRDAGLWSMRVPKKFGGPGLDLVTTCLVVEEISKKCPSTAMCFKMHLEAVEAISQVPTEYQRQRYIEPLLRGEMFAAAPGGEPHGKTGDDWTPVPQSVTTLPRVEGGFHLDHIRKSYVTSAGHATHYIMFCRIEGGRTEGPPELLMFKNDEVEWETIGEWNGLGMRGNSSVPMIFNGVVPEENLVGIELADQSVPVMTKYMSPCLILTYGAAYLGIASGAFELACEEGDKRYPSGARRLDNPINQRRMAEMSAQIEAARALLHVAAAMADSGRADSVLPLLQAKVLCSEAAVRVTTDLMTIFGGTAFAARLPFERYFRDARAGLVMGQANDVAYRTIGTLLFPED
ncbi:MAG: acyl-CoA/acyl-ACP dehydrogenase [Chloroflexi bacterium]|nr:acyl-CoA/acyl-ACP dehydrogenase [Chloroflexota bacterium]MDA1272344.1 acyl-CoA/acyl-ACP dehydrogenase [Chloroflexota bacterium]